MAFASFAYRRGHSSSHATSSLQMEQEIVEAIMENDAVIVCGETGSGKSRKSRSFYTKLALPPRHRHRRKEKVNQVSVGKGEFR